MSKKLDVVVAGYLCLDMAPRFPRGGHGPVGLRPGALIEVEGMDVSLGGVVPNTGLALDRFGRKVVLCGTVGRDDMGDLIMRLLEKKQHGSSIKRHPETATAFGLVISPPGSDRFFLECAGCNDHFSQEDVNWEAVADARIFHFGYPTLMRSYREDGGEALAAMFKRARELGAVTSLDTTVPDEAGEAATIDWGKMLRTSLPQVDIFVPSAEELVRMLAPDEYHRLRNRAGNDDILEIIPQELLAEIAGQVAALGVKILLIKAGSRGALLQVRNCAEFGESTGLFRSSPPWPDCREWIEPFSVDENSIVNACGAGDAAVAGFLAALLEGMPAKEAARLSMLAGRDSLYGSDALGGLRDWSIMTAEAG